MHKVSEKIRQNRKKKLLTLKELSEFTGLSVSFLSQVERGISSLTISSLQRVANAMNIPVRDFFEDKTSENFIVKKKDQKPVKFGGLPQVAVKISSHFQGSTIEPIILTLPPEYPPGKKHSHSGEGFYYVLEGAAAFKIHNEEFLLKNGEAIHFPKNMEHEWGNPFDRQAKLFCVLT